MIGKDGQTMRLLLSKNGISIGAIKFKAMDTFNYLNDKFNGNIRGSKVDIVYFPDVNEFRGKKTLQLHIIDLR